MKAWQKKDHEITDVSTLRPPYGEIQVGERRKASSAAKPVFEAQNHVPRTRRTQKTPNQASTL